MNTNIHIKTDTKILIAYHANCIDGFTSAWVVYDEHICSGIPPECIDLLPMSYGQNNSIVSQSEWDMLGMMQRHSYTGVYIVDFSVSLACLDEIKEQHRKSTVTILDHHKTAFERYAVGITVDESSSLYETSGNVNILLKNNESGASLCWKYFNLGVTQDSDLNLPAIVKYVKDYDIWKFKYGNDTRYVNQVLKGRDKTIRSWSVIAASMEIEADMDNILLAGANLQRAHNELVFDIASGASHINIAGYNGLAVECEYKYISDVGHKLAETCGTFGAMYQIDKDKLEVKWSLRGVADMDVSHIANQFGGGGHKGAAGFIIPMIPEIV